MTAKKSKRAIAAQAEIREIEGSGVEFHVAPEFQEPATAAPTAVETATTAPKKKPSKSKAREAHDHVREVDGKAVVFRVEVDDNDPAKATTAANETTEPPAPKKAKAKKAAKADSEFTMEQLASGYLAMLEDTGSGSGTISSYGMELKLAIKELGSETPVALLTEDRVGEFFRCDAVMKTRTGKPKAPPTFLKTQRVLRQALVWAAAEKLIDRAPIPEMTTTKS